MMTCKVETIDRQTAIRYLTRDKGDNRPFSVRHLRDLTARQRRGEWLPNGDTIKFDSNDQLRDGQHRLTMVKNTGIPIEVIVVEGINPNAFWTIDVGKHRNFSDVLAINHEAHSTRLAGATSMVWRYLAKQMNTRSSTSYEAMSRILASHPGIRDSVDFNLSIIRPPSSPGYPAITIGAHYLFSRVDKPAADVFISRYITGLQAETSTDPIHVLREQLISFKRLNSPPNMRQVFTIMCKAWNSYQTNKPQKIRWQMPDIRKISKAPHIHGFPKDLFLLDLNGNTDEDVEIIEEEET